ncbi:MAG: thiol-disulfide isomerase [Acidobacteriota bacterium]
MRLACSFVVAAAVSLAAPTYTKDVAPILNARCAECHRKGEAAPMALTSYTEARPWAKAIRQAVVTKRMPVWLADPALDHFKNDRRLSAAEIETIKAWADAGAPEGNAKDLPVPPQFTEGWSIGKPDLIVDMGEDFDVPATGEVPYKYFVVDPGFTQDTWVQSVEVRAGTRAVVHHVIVFLLNDQEKALARSGGDLLVGWAPGEQPVQLPEGTARLIRAGTVFRFQVHYTPSGKPAKDRSYVGLRFAKETPQYRSLIGRAINTKIRIPAQAPNHEERAVWTSTRDVALTSLMPHMHVRGKDFLYTLVTPDGSRKVLLNVPRYDFNWQLGYSFKEQIEVPKGSRIEVVAHYDNSPNNKANPDPGKEVLWGDQTWEEMLIGWFTYRIPVDSPAVATAAQSRPPSASAEK